MTVTSEPAPPGAPSRPGVRAILTPGWLGVIAIAVLFAGACWVILAPWQFGRHAERVAQNAQIESAMAAPVVPVTELLAADRQPAPASQWRPVSATGTFQPDQQVFVRLRQLNGQNAREVVVPFQLIDGTRILVDRGYLLETDVAAGRLPSDVPTGQVTITGRVSVDQPDPAHRPDQLVDGRREVYGIDSAALLGPASGALHGFVQLTGGSPGVLIEVGVPARDDGPFLSYALQWCVFGAVALLAAGFFAYREMTDPYGETGSPGPRRSGGKFDRSELYD